MPASFSSIDADLWTPGSDILSDYPNQEIGYLSGTSMATPIATGTAAMVWGANPNLKASEVKDILIKANRPFKAVMEFAEVPLTIDSGINTLNSYYAVNEALESLKSPGIDFGTSGSEQEYAVLMGHLYEEAEGNPVIDLSNVPDIMLTVTDDKELYQKDVECLDDGGSFVFYIKPGTYRLTVDCSYYDSYEIELTVKDGDVQYLALGLGREEVKKRLLNEYVESLNTYYADSYQYTISRQNTGGTVNMERSIEGFEAERKLGYMIDDFDDDGETELLVIATDDDFNIVYEMYAVDGNEVTIVAQEITIADEMYGNVTLPLSSDGGGGDCALISCFVEEETHNIFLQVSYNISAFIDGQATFITSIRYEEGDFCDMQGLCVVGSSCENGYPSDNLKLLRMGVPIPDIEAMFEGLSPLYECFDGGIYEIFHARQKTLDTERDENGRLSSIQAITIFSTKEELYIKTVDAVEKIIPLKEEQHELYAPIIDEYDKEMKEAASLIGEEGRATYYRFIDVDEDGIDELLLDYELARYGSYEINAFGSIHGECFSFYTLIDGRPNAVYKGKYIPMGEGDAYVHVHPEISLVEFGYNNYRQYFTYRNYTISETPVFTCINWGDNYEINGNIYSKEDFRNFSFDLGSTKADSRTTYRMLIYHEEEYVPFYDE